MESVQLPSCTVRKSSVRVQRKLNVSKTNTNYNSNTQRNALEKFGREKLGIKQLDDWYHAKTRDVHNKLTFIRTNHRSLSNALKNLYPQHNWDPLHYSRALNGSWADENTQREALERYGREKLGVKELDDWYKVSKEEVKLSFIGNYYNSSLYDALKKLYPQHHWDPLRFSRVPRGSWTDDKIQREAIERLGRKLGVKELDDWYSVSAKEVTNELSFIYSHFRGSLFDALQSLYPQHNWDPLKFSIVPRNYWNDEAAQKDALERLGKELGVKELDDWYQVSARKVHSSLSFLKKYGSLFDALKKFYPQHDWDRLKFSRMPTGFWEDESAQREALDRLGKELGVKELDDWYQVPAANVRKLSFLKKYESMYDALRTLYPHHAWDRINFSRVPAGYWLDANVVQYYRNMFTEWKSRYDIKSVGDWYELPPQQVKQLKRVSVGIFGSTVKMLEQWFPEIVWQWQYTSQLELQVSILGYAFITHFDLQHLLKHVIVDANVKHYRSKNT